MRDSITPVLYVITVATITFLYVDYKNIERLKHPLKTSVQSLVRATSSGSQGLILGQVQICCTEIDLSP